MILAAIDIGSNAARLLITDAHKYKDGSIDYTKLNFLRIPLRLGMDVFKDGKINAVRKSMLLDTMKIFRQLMDIYKVEHYYAAATSALRDASNNTSIVKEIAENCNVIINVITGQEEANILFENHFAETLGKQTAHLYIDVGGGSTELTLFNNGNIIAKESFNIGTIRLLTKTVEKQEWKTIKTFIKNNIQNFKAIDAIGSGGNINKVYNLSKIKNNNPITTIALQEFYQKLKKLSIEERMHQYDLKQDRADVIVPALEIYCSVLEWANIKNVFVPQIGVADGIIKMLYKKYNL